MDTHMLITVVIPVKNEEATVPGLAAEIQAAFAEADFPWEALWVDDGSTDGTRAVLAALPSPQRWIALDRNHGQSAALMAGFREARGEWIGTLDGDGQNDPADLPRQLALARESGVDMVNGIRAKRNDSRIRKLSSKIGNGARNWLTRETVSDVGCSTRVVRRALLLQLPFFHGMHRFLPTLVRMRGGSMCEIPVNHRPRAGGRSKYGINNRLWSGLRDIFGVRWLQSRNRCWQVNERGEIR
jgi:dolichol-phosphate mannosyltransferase